MSTPLTPAIFAKAGRTRRWAIDEKPKRSTCMIAHHSIISVDRGCSRDGALLGLTVMTSHPIVEIGIQRLLPPIRMFDIPIHRACDTACKRLLGRDAQFAIDL